MITRAQQILIKRAQREAGLDDEAYRDALLAVSGCRSTTDPRLSDRDVDLVLAYFEAIYWRKADAGELPVPCSPNAAFRQRGYWASRNPRGNTTRDRFNNHSLAEELSRLEGCLQDLGFGPDYCAGIRSRSTHGQNDQQALRFYLAALKRTLHAKQRSAVAVPADIPF
jgi:hypothetical protein